MTVESALKLMAMAKRGKCDVQLTAFPDIPETLAKQIVLSLGPVK